MLVVVLNVFSNYFKPVLNYNLSSYSLHNLFQFLFLVGKLFANFKAFLFTKINDKLAIGLQSSFKEYFSKLICFFNVIQTSAKRKHK